MQIEIPSDLESFVEQEFATGRYATREEVRSPKSNRGSATQRPAGRSGLQTDLPKPNRNSDSLERTKCCD